MTLEDNLGLSVLALTWIAGFVWSNEFVLVAGGFGSICFGINWLHKVHTRERYYKLNKKIKNQRDEKNLDDD